LFLGYVSVDSLVFAPLDMIDHYRQSHGLFEVSLLSQ
jgi:hypothetical protein